MPISPAPPRGRKTSSWELGVSAIRAINVSTPLSLRDRSRFSVLGIARVDQHEPLHGEIGVDMVDHGNLALEDGGKAAGGDHGHRLAELCLDAGDQALDQADIAPIHAG